MRTTQLADSVKWKQPVIVKEAEWREAAPILRKINIQCAIYYMAFGVPIAIYCSHVLGTPLTGWLLRIGFAFAFIPLHMIQVWATRKSRQEYQLNEKGVQYRGIYYQWPRLEAYAFGDSETICDTRNISLKIRGLEGWTVLPFSSGDVSEQEISDVLRQFAPTAEARKDCNLTLAEWEVDKNTKLRRIRLYLCMSVLFGIGSLATIVALCLGYLNGPLASSCFGSVVLCLVSAVGFYELKRRYREALAKFDQSLSPQKEMTPWYTD